MDPVEFLFQDAQVAYDAFRKYPTAEHGEVARKSLKKLHDEVDSRIELTLRPKQVTP